MTKTILFAVALLSAACALASDNVGGRYGAVAHLNIWEFDKHGEELALMREAGIDWCRTDIALSHVETKRDNWDFSRWDSVYEAARANGVNMLPIFGLPRPSWDYANLHPEVFVPYLKKCLKHFDGKISFWEAVNEPNLKDVSPEEYVKLLKTINREVKNRNPKSTTVLGGMSGVPLDYLEKCLKLGAADSFDVMNVHPYQMRLLPEFNLRRELKGLKKLMRKYDVDKPIWLTEIGNSSGEINRAIPKYFERALQRLGFDLSKTEVAVICDDVYGLYSGGLSRRVDRFLPSAKKLKKITASEVGNLSVKDTPILLLCTLREEFPRAASEAASKYLRDGGTIVNYGGNPFFFDLKLDSDGTPYRDSETTFPLIKLRLGRHGQWANKNLPVKMRKFESAKGYEDIKMDGWFLSAVADNHLGEGGEFEPFVYAVCDGKKYPFGAVHKYRGDMKGNYISTFSWQGEVSDEAAQARLLTRTYILALAEKVDKIFLYEFRSSETDNTRESHFGAVRKNLEKKPQFYALKTVIEMLGQKAFPKISRDGDMFVAKWKRPDGKKAAAAWTLSQPRKARLSGTCEAAFDCLGNQLKTPAEGEIIVADSPVYYVGDVEIAREPQN